MLLLYVSFLSKESVRPHRAAKEDIKWIELYANTPMQYTAIFHSCQNVNFQMNFFNIFLIFAQNIDCGYSAVDDIDFYGIKYTHRSKG